MNSSYNTVIILNSLVYDSLAGNIFITRTISKMDLQVKDKPELFW